MKRPEKGLFVVGTDTEVGKTYVASLIVKAMHANGEQIGVYKPVASGCSKKDGRFHSADAWQLWEAAGQPKRIVDVVPQCFLAPLAPHLAARKEKRTVDMQLLRDGIEVWSDFPSIIVEGVGGILSPISDGDLVADLVVEFGYPLLIVVPNSLGAINQTLLTLLAAKQYNIPVQGIILNNPRQQQDESSGSNVSEISRHTMTPILAEIPYGATSLGYDPMGWM